MGLEQGAGSAAFEMCISDSKPLCAGERFRGQIMGSYVNSKKREERVCWIVKSSITTFKDIDVYRSKQRSVDVWKHYFTGRNGGEEV